MQNVYVILLSAGRGTRAGSGLPKTYRNLNGRPIIAHAMECFLSCDFVTKIQPVIASEDYQLFPKFNDIRIADPTIGGDTRAKSVAAGMAKLPDQGIVLIHDAARPFVSRPVIERVIAALDDADGAIPALPVADALWSVKDNQLKKTIDRNHVIRAQTPQAFHIDRYRLAMNDPYALDDAQAAVAAGLKVVFVNGDPKNKKLTYPEDFT